MATITKYNLGTQYQYNGTAAIDWDTDTIKVALVTSAYTPSATTHNYFDVVTANQVSGTNYSAGGTALTGLAVTENAGTVKVDANDVTWAQSGTGFSNARYAIIYKDTGTASTSPLFGYIDFTSDKGNVSGDLTLSWNANGIFTVA